MTPVGLSTEGVRSGTFPVKFSASSNTLSAVRTGRYASPILCLPHFAYRCKPLSPHETSQIVIELRAVDSPDQSFLFYYLYRSVFRVRSSLL